MLSALEIVVWTAAAGLLLGGVGSGLSDHVMQQARLAQFSAAESGAPDTRMALRDIETPDRSDWSAIRVRKYQELKRNHHQMPQAVLRIPVLRLEAEIFSDTEDRSLDLGIGHIEGTARPGENGHIGLAGHRDSYFRRLGDVASDSTIEIVTAHGRWIYAVEDTSIVDPDDVHVLAPTGEPTLTLVTCYPFYFMGNAPQRFIVRARLIRAAPLLPSPPTKESV